MCAAPPTIVARFYGYYYSMIAEKQILKCRLVILLIKRSSCCSNSHLAFSFHSLIVVSLCLIFTHTTSLQLCFLNSSPCRNGRRVNKVNCGCVKYFLSISRSKKFLFRGWLVRHSQNIYSDNQVLTSCYLSFPFVCDFVQQILTFTIYLHRSCHLPSCPIITHYAASFSLCIYTRTYIFLFG